MRVNAGTESIWYEDPIILDPLLNKCGYSRVANCTRNDRIYCGDSYPSVVRECKDSGGLNFRSWVMMYGYAEIQIGSRIIGGCLSAKDGSGSTSAILGR
jgi:hypothetical protein